MVRHELAASSSDPATRGRPSAIWRGRSRARRGPLSPALSRGLPWGRGDRHLHALATRLLWLYAVAHGDQARARARRAGAREPTACTVARAARVAGPGDLRARGRGDRSCPRRPHADVDPEIGAGYGRTAYSLRGLFPEANYTIVAIEPALTLSRFYLSTLYPGRDVRYVDAAQDDPDISRGHRSRGVDLVAARDDAGAGVEPRADTGQGRRRGGVPQAVEPVAQPGRRRGDGVRPATRFWKRGHCCSASRLRCRRASPRLRGGS